MNKLITQEELKKILHYNPDSGIFTRIKNNKITNSISVDGYVVIKVKGIIYKGHRLAWLYIYGEWPKHEIDHINSVRSDNGIINLRDVTKLENQQNQTKARKDNNCGYLGVSIFKDKFQSRIMVNKKSLFIGTFNTAIEAHEAYLNAKRYLHKTCTI